MSAPAPLSLSMHSLLTFSVPLTCLRYIKFLPDELLPTFWTEEELDLATGTTLRPAVRAKKSSLLREFENFRTATEDISWCAKYWWNEDDGLVSATVKR